MILIIDNYDSFTYNLVQQIEKLGFKTKVAKHDKISIPAIKKENPQKIVISPGPKTPSEAGISNEVIKNFYQNKPILGVCLGHECMGEIFGSKVTKAKKVLHGKTSKISHNNSALFKKVQNPTIVARYHSLILDKVPNSFKLTAKTADNEIMAIEHKKFPCFGIQFHPESFLTEEGDQIMQNFLEL